MKTFSFKKTVGLSLMISGGLALTALHSVSVKADNEHGTTVQAEGGGSTGGGDDYAAHFSAVGSRVDAAFGLLCKGGAAIDPALCKIYPDFSAAQAARVLPRDSVLGNDHQLREAGPDGQGNIELNVPLYQKRIEASGAAERIVGLVAHEYMIIAQQESADSYTTSKLLVDAFHRNYIDFSGLMGTVILSTPTHIGPCSEANLATVPEHFKCRTTKQGIYERVSRPYFGEAWKGPEGLIWSQNIGFQPQSWAVESCNSLGASLASKSDLQRAESSGFREVSPFFRNARHEEDGTFDRIWGSIPSDTPASKYAPYLDSQGKVFIDSAFFTQSGMVCVSSP